MNEKCYTCPVILTCYADCLEDAILCPQCKVLQITHRTKSGEIEVHPIQCPIRRLTQKQFALWTDEYTLLGAGNGRYDAHRKRIIPNKAYTLTNIIFIPDPGPLQKTNDLRVALCNVCYERLTSEEN